MNCLNDDDLQRAHQMLSLIHSDRVRVIRLLTDALIYLPILVFKQDKRLLYSNSKYRTKVVMPERHLWQLLLFIVSDLDERQQEQTPEGAALTLEDMIIRFLKYLTQITIKRNLFYVTIGYGRFLYDYSTPQVMSLYSQLVCHADQSINEAHGRAAKQKLMRELEARFGTRLRKETGGRGEERFQVQDPPGRWAALVREGLRHFTLWNTPHLPDPFRPGQDLLPVRYASEVNRMHMIQDPSCLERWTRALRLDAPALVLPRFFLPNADRGNHSGGGNGGQSWPLTEDERQAIKTTVAEQARRRKAVLGGWPYLSILVDGRERARLERLRTDRVRLTLAATAQLIEVRAPDSEGDVVLGVYLLSDDDYESGDGTATVGMALEGGQKLSFSVSRTTGSSEEAGALMMEVVYQEAHPLRAAAWYLKQWPRWFWPARPRVLATAALLVLLAVVPIYYLSRSRSWASLGVQEFEKELDQRVRVARSSLSSGTTAADDWMSILQQGDRRQARARLLALCQAHPYSFEAHYYLGLCYLADARRGLLQRKDSVHVAEGIRYMARAGALAPNPAFQANCYFYLAWAHVMDNDYGLARKYLWNILNLEDSGQPVQQKKELARELLNKIQ
ncbi:MAG: hypothetical protein HYR55_20880 [Acidobacteria bacterium]|nr:hypothetical protein [Acidobacteriota bacterium]